MKKYFITLAIALACIAAAKEDPITAVVTFDTLTEEQVNAIKAKIGLNATMTVDEYYATNIILPLIQQHNLKLHRLVLEHKGELINFDFVKDNLDVLSEQDLQELTVKIKLAKKKQGK